ncbi:hypothetical protein BGZ57DRAFT_932116 [Hyaloscypha finlandica]|nr:hypothetical protein BGZ57DRAFT_932116 [Hyaloscypha finlandica]
MLVEKSVPELPNSSLTHPIFRRTEVGRNRQGFIAEEELDDGSPDYFGRHQVDVKSLTTLENLPEPEISHPPTYEESETSAGIDENGTPHQVTVRSLSVSEAVPGPKYPHVWQIKRTTITLSSLEATVLVKAGILEYKDLRLYKSTTNLNDQGPADPITGAISAVFGTVGTVCLRVADYPLILSTVFNPPAGSNASDEATRFARDPEKGVTGIVGAGLKAPVDITYNMARGFHNLPKLYGDRMVRNLGPITGAGSGFKAAGKEFGLGCWDGVSGLVMQPVKGAQETGVLGSMKDFGKGVAGLAFKPAAGALGLAGYSGRGMYEQVQKVRGNKSKRAVREAQITQGLQEWEVTTEEEKRRILQKTKEDLEEFDRILGVVKLL